MRACPLHYGGTGQIARLFHAYRVFSRDRAHIRGKSIPQGHSASDILAKVYLNAVDAELRDLGYRHVRYVDDFRMFCRSRSEAAKALLDLSRSLRKRGLVLNSAKSQFHPAGEARQNIDGAIPVIEGVRENIVQMITDALGKLCTGGCAERLAESGHDNRVQRMEVE